MSDVRIEKVPRDSWSSGQDRWSVYAGNLLLGHIIATGLPNGAHRVKLQIGVGPFDWPASTLEAGRQLVQRRWNEWLAESGLCVPVTSDDPEVAAVLAEFGGDPLVAIRGLLDDVATLARDADQVVSRGYVRGHLFAARQRAAGRER